MSFKHNHFIEIHVFVILIKSWKESTVSRFVIFYAREGKQKALTLHLYKTHKEAKSPWNFQMNSQNLNLLRFMNIEVKLFPSF